MCRDENYFASKWHSEALYTLADKINCASEEQGSEKTPTNPAKFTICKSNRKSCPDSKVVVICEHDEWCEGKQ